MTTPQEEAVRRATFRFYEALDELLLGHGTDAMCDAWHQGDFTSTVHIVGHWAWGWTEVLATWKEIGAVFSLYRGHVGRPHGIGTIHDLHIAMMGDAAYTTGIYKSLLFLPEGEMRLSVNCTNVLWLRDGEWKVVHHHPDQAPADYQAAIARIVTGGG